MSTLWSPDKLRDRFREEFFGILRSQSPELRSQFWHQSSEKRTGAYYGEEILPHVAGRMDADCGASRIVGILPRVAGRMDANLVLKRELLRVDWAF